MTTYLNVSIICLQLPLPDGLDERVVLLLDPMLGTGGSACKAIETLIEKGAKEEKIIFINLLSCPEGIEKIHESFPDVRIVTGFIDPGMNESFFLVPGLGDFGDRYFGTD